MATLVLSTVGTIFGGPLGGALGALVGQSIDQEIFGPSHRGPKLGDLSVQTSSYGTQVPRVYGAMRVAGSVIWSTDLVQSEQTSGAKGQPDVTYSYAVSFAVALSSRVVTSIGRIWADGKLLRGADGTFKVSTGFRFYDGSEDQIIDPLIGSIEGIANTPAYRGLAMAVFDTMQLAEFGNRIPFITFEVLADDQPPTIDAVLGDASEGTIKAGDPRTLRGFAAYGQSIRDAVDTIVTTYAIDLFDDGSSVRAAQAAPMEFAVADLGNGADAKPAPKVEREQQRADDLPATLRLSYYDPDRDYQTGEARAASGERLGREMRQELPAVLQATEAKALAQEVMAASWSMRDRLTLRLPPSAIGVEPGSRITLDLSPSQWIVERCSIEAFVPVVELHPARSSSPAIAADSGRIVAPVDIAATTLIVAVADIPALTTDAATQPSVLVAASAPGAGWRACSLEFDVAGHTFHVTSAGRKSVLGEAVGRLDDADPALIDESNLVDVQLIDKDQWLTSCTSDDLVAGHNLALLGCELVQFANAIELGEGRFRLSRLLRGRAGTEWAMSAHTAAETFFLIDMNALAPVALPPWSIGSSATARAIASDRTTSLVVSGEALRPPCPVWLAASRQTNGDLLLSWTRRSRSGWAWLDEIEVPLGESKEEYRIDITGSAGSLQSSASAPTLTISSSFLPSLGAGPATVSIRQVGDYALSRPANLIVNL